MFLFALFLAAAAPLAPSNLNLVVAPADAQIKQPQPRCAQGPFNDADDNGDVDGTEGTGCPGSAHFAASGTGFSVEINTGDLAGTMVSVADAAASGGTAVGIPAGGGGLASGQVRLRTPVLPAGTYTLWVLEKVEVSGKRLTWTSTAPHLLLPPPDSTQQTDPCNQAGICVSGLILNYTWVKQDQTITGGAARDIYLTASDSKKMDCAYIDTDPNAPKTCPSPVAPPAASYAILDTASTPASVADSQWAGANNVPLNGLNTGVTGVHSCQILWNSVAQKVCIRLRIEAAGLTSTVSADDDPATGDADTAIWWDFRLDTQAAANSTTYRLVANSQSTPAVFEGNFPSGTISSTLDFASVAKSRSYAANVLLVMICFDLPSAVVAGQFGSFDLFTQEFIASVLHYRTAGSPTGVSLDFQNWLTAEFSASVVGGADTTIPVLSQPKLVSNGTNSQSWTYTCVDAGSGCASAFLDWDTNSGTPYNGSPANSSCILGGTNPNYAANCTLTGLNPGVSYFVCGRALDGAGNSGVCSSENNAATDSVTGEYFTATGTGIAPCAYALPCPISMIPSRAFPGKTLIIKDSATAHAVQSLILVGGSNTVSGTPAAPITLRCETMVASDGTGFPGCKLLGDGTKWVIDAGNISWWIFEGLHIENVDNSTQAGGDQGGIFFGSSFNNNIVRKNIFRNINRWANTHPITISMGSAGSCGNVIEENDVLRYHRNAIEFISNAAERNICQTTAGNFANLNYVGQGLDRDPFICDPPNPAECDPLGPADGIVDYNSGDTTWQNNIVESNQENCFTGWGNRNRHYGGIALGCAQNGFVFGPEDAANGEAFDNAFKDIVVKGALQGIWITPQRYTVSNATVLDIDSSHFGLIADNGANYSNLSIQVTNVLDPAGINWIGLADVASFQTPAGTHQLLEYSQSFGGSYPNFTLVQTPPTPPGNVNPAMGQCVARVPSTSPFFSTGKNGASVGADATFRWVNGIRTTDRVFNFALTGADRGKQNLFGPGVKPGVNDSSTGLVRSTVHLRLGYGTGTCASP